MPIACVVAAIIPNVALAQASEQANRSAYVYAMRCFAAAAGVISDAHSTPAERAAARERSHRTFDAVVRMGRLLGLSGQTISDDVEASSRAEAALMVRDPVYFRRAQEECARLGL